MPTTNIIVVDDFYVNVMGTRNFILTQDFKVTGNYPGYRTKSYANNSIKGHLEKIIGKRISWFPTNEDSYNGAFQYTTKDMKSWIHRDTTRWAGLVYLTPDAPLSAGTAFFRHNETGLEEIMSDTSDEIKKKLDNDSNDMSKWTQVDYVGNKFNRLVLFRGTRSHRSMDYFGTNKHNGRLFQLFFFNVDEKSDIYAIPKTLHTTTPTKTTQKTLSNPSNLTKVSIKTRQVEPKVWNKPDRKLKITILFFTTSRYEYLIPMLKSFHEKVDFGDAEVTKILIDDYPLRRKIPVLEQLVKDFNIDKLVLNEENLGYSSSWKKGWGFVPNDTDYIWHQEDDFTFNKVVNVYDMIETLETCPIELTQVVLKRQVWFTGGDFIEKIETGKVGEQIEFGDKKVVIHKTYFNSNPCVYSRWVLDEDYKYNPQEHLIVDHMNKKYPNKYSSMYGGALDEPYIDHIGVYNQGKKVNEDEPGYQYVKPYDPTKQYYSNKWVTEYTQSK